MTRKHVLGMKGVPALLLAGAFLLLLPAAMAGVTLEQKIRNEGFGAKGTGAMSGTQFLTIEEEMAREETTSEFTGKVLRKFSGNMGSITITRLDRGLIWQIHPKKKAYTELTFEQMRRQREEAMTQMEATVGGAQHEPDETAPPGESDLEWSEPTLEANRTENTETIAGLPAGQVVITVTTTGTHKQSGETCSVVWGLDLWMGPETDASKQIRAYHQRLAEAMGFSRREMEIAGGQAMSMLQSFGNGWEKLYEEMSGMEGMPLRSTMKLTVDGACETGDGESSAVESDSGGKGFRGFGKKLLGKLGRKKKAEAPPAGKGPQQLFAITTETVSIMEESVPSDRFQVPEGYKKLEPAGLGQSD